MSDTIILDSKKCNAELLTIHTDGRITVSENLKPTETAAEVLKIMQDMWLSNQQVVKIKELQDHIKRLEEAGDRMRLYCADPDDCFAWDKAKEANL